MQGHFVFYSLLLTLAPGEDSICSKVLSFHLRYLGIVLQPSTDISGYIFNSLLYPIGHDEKFL